MEVQNSQHKLVQPGIIGRKVFFGSTDCHFYALDAITGKQVWVFEASTLTPSKFREWEKLGAEITIMPEQEEEREDDKSYEFNLSVRETDSGEYSVKTQYLTKSGYQMDAEYG